MRHILFDLSGRDGGRHRIRNLKRIPLRSLDARWDEQLHAPCAPDGDGLPVYRGDTPIYSWRANNGSGPPIYFEIHADRITGGYFKYYNTTATLISDGTWTAPTTDRCLVYWVNLSNTTAVKLTYSFVLVVAQADARPLYVAPAAIVLVAITGLAAPVRTRKRSPPWAQVGSKDSVETQAADEPPAPREEK